MARLLILNKLKDDLLRHPKAPLYQDYADNAEAVSFYDFFRLKEYFY